MHLFLQDTQRAYTSTKSDKKLLHSKEIVNCCSSSRYILHQCISADRIFYHISKKHLCSIGFWCIFTPSTHDFLVSWQSFIDPYTYTAAASYACFTAFHCPTTSWISRFTWESYSQMN